ncbi:MAG: EAL domain-containing protein [Clostridiales bacterium]|nr:EAL domain-containing protein [Clostridiales bacterium]
MTKKEGSPKTRVIEDTLNRIYESKNASFRGGFVILLILYFTAAIIVSMVASAPGSISIGNAQVPISIFAGVLSSLSSICVIILTVFYGKPGYYTSLAVLVFHIPFVLMAIIVRNNMSSIPGVFGSILAIVAITMIYLKNRRLAEYQKELRAQAVTDIMTGLPNRFACSELIQGLVDKGEPYTVVYIDINGFGNINEAMGFETGNEVLVDIASRWKKIADESKTDTLDFIARINGDEFVLIIRNFRSEEDILKTIGAYEAALGDKLTIFGCDFFISASFGYAIFPEDSDKPDTVFSYANNAMREIKRAGSSNHILKFTPDILKSEHTLEIENKIRAALRNDSIFFLLQPQYDMTHKLRGFEALARMKDENGSVISPVDFIPVAEKVGLIDQVDSRVFRKSAEFIGGLINKTGSDVTLSINVSVRHLMKNDFLEEMKTILNESGIPAKQLEVEITESIMIESMEKAMYCIQEIKKMGIQIAIDDFGTGYSSLSYLNSFPADLLKIDKSFIDKMNTSASSKQYVAAIISLGHILGFNVISEGVEADDQLQTLRSIDCDYVQGYVWGRPLSKEDAEKVLMASL